MMQAWILFIILKDVGLKHAHFLICSRTRQEMLEEILIKHVTCEPDPDISDPTLILSGSSQLRDAFAKRYLKEEFEVFELATRTVIARLQLHDIESTRGCKQYCTPPRGVHLG